MNDKGLSIQIVEADDMWKEKFGQDTMTVRIRENGHMGAVLLSRGAAEKLRKAVEPTRLEAHDPNMTSCACITCGRQCPNDCPMDKNAGPDSIRRECLLDVRAAINLDKETFAGVGRETKGHSRALMLIDEMLAAIMSAEKGGAYGKNGGEVES